LDTHTISINMTLRNTRVICTTLFFFWVLGCYTGIAQDNDLDTGWKYIREGRSFYNADQFKQSLEYFDKAGVIAATSKSDTLMCIVQTMKGHAFMLSGDNKKALDAYHGALAITQKLGYLDREVVINSGLILVLKRMNQLDKAHQIASEMLKSISKTSFKNTRNHVNILTTVSDIYLAREQYDSVLSFAEQGIVISKLLDYKEGLLDFYVKKGMIYYYKKKYDVSLKHLFEAQDVLQHQGLTNRFYPIVNSNYFLASCYYEQGDYEKAIEVLDQTIHMLKEEDMMKPPVIQTHLLLANCYREQKDFEKALYWNNQYVTLTNDFQKEKDITVNTIFEKEAEKLEVEIKSLKNEQEANTKIKTYGVLGLLLLILFILLITYRYYQGKKSNKVRFDDLMQKISVLEHQEKEPARQTITEIAIDDDKIVAVLKGLDKLESQEFFLRSDCNLRAMAKKVKTNATYLSKIINIHKEKNFNDYINDLRIEYVLRRLKDDRKFRSFSIKSIATEIGYKSDFSFSKHFRAKTGLNPSYYIKNIEDSAKQYENVH